MPVQETGVQSVPDVASLPVSIIVAASLPRTAWNNRRVQEYVRIVSTAQGQNGK